MTREARREIRIKLELSRCAAEEVCMGWKEQGIPATILKDGTIEIEQETSFRLNFDPLEAYNELKKWRFVCSGLYRITDLEGFFGKYKNPVVEFEGTLGKDAKIIIYRKEISDEGKRISERVRQMLLKTGYT